VQAELSAIETTAATAAAAAAACGAAELARVEATVLQLQESLTAAQESVQESLVDVGSARAAARDAAAQLEKQEETAVRLTN
jgi:hypothetical protein